MAITVLKNNVPWGPFTRAQIQAGLARGDFTLQYLAHGPGLKEWLPLGQVLSYVDPVASLPPVPGTGPIPAAPKPISPARRPNPEPPPAPIIPARSAMPPPMPAAAQVVASGLPTEGAKPRAVEPPKPALNVAAFFPRFLAFAIDCGVLFLPVLFLFGLGMLAVEIQGSLEHTDAESMRQERLLLQQNFRNILGLVALGGAWLYAASLECSRWQATVGKQWMGMKVTDGAGERVSFFRATGRHAGKFLSALPLFLGFTMALFSKRRLALHDRMAGTQVVKKARVGLPAGK